ncbi:MAG TPA: hypothetical protein VFG53_04240 [Anaeromyxobacter sp.]|nr:hypothetical protein [Anaeromyxobacter sp.]
MNRPPSRWLLALLASPLLLSGACRRDRPGQVLDEALRAHRQAASFPAADEDYFHDMDGGAALTPDEVKGRNTWLVWTGGNDRMWDLLTSGSVGSLDFLKTLSSFPGLKASRDNRWNYLGLVNEPCFEKPTGPDPERFGLWLDRRRTGPDCPPDPFENAEKYPGVVLGARGKTVPVGSYYGYATGVVGLRLFPNPDFDEAALRRWDPKRYYEDKSYYLDKNLVRPYRVGMSCAFCHVGPSPLRPPADPENPRWENLSSTVGAQYFWVDRIFAWEADPTSFAFQLFHTARPGTLDTSLISSDNINNPRTMNAVYLLPERMALAKRFGKETLAGGGLENKQFNDFEAGRPFDSFFEAPATVFTPRVLKDGSDSVGALGALNRVYLNIGLFSEEWLLHFRPLVGGAPITPIPIATARKNSTYWNATEQQTPGMALFLLKASGAHHLRDAPGGEDLLSHDPAQLERGKEVFADRCARCHSSKIPEPAPGVDPGGCAGKDYLRCFGKYWDWTKTDAFKSQMLALVKRPDFLLGNYLSTELRIPATLLQTNACSPLATNAIAGNIWDNFSSQTYKDLPSVGAITVRHPVTGQPFTFPLPGGGRGYTRPASLVSAWSTAPFLLNNSVGRFDPSPSVDSRVRSFENAMEQLLWPEKRPHDPVLSGKVSDGFVGWIDRTTEQSYLRIPMGYLPDLLKDLRRPAERLFPWVFNETGIEIGPIPKGTPIGLLANLDLLGEAAPPGEERARQEKVVELLVTIEHDLKALPKNASDEEAEKVFANVVDRLLELSRCPDLEVNRGHYFGTSYFPEEPALSDDDKRALIEYVKTF